MGVMKLSTDVRQLCKKYETNQISESEFKNELIEIISKYSGQSRLYQNIGEAVQSHFFPNEDFKLEIPKNDIWKMIEEVEPRIKKEYLNWAEAMKK